MLHVDISFVLFLICFFLFCFVLFLLFFVSCFVFFPYFSVESHFFFKFRFSQRSTPRSGQAARTSSASLWVISTGASLLPGNAQPEDPPPPIIGLLQAAPTALVATNGRQTKLKFVRWWGSTQPLMAANGRHMGFRGLVTVGA